MKARRTTPVIVYLTYLMLDILQEPPVFHPASKRLRLSSLSKSPHVCVRGDGALEEQLADYWLIRLAQDLVKELLIL